MANRPKPSRKTITPDRHAEAIKRAMILFNRGDRDGCLDGLRRVLKADPRHVQAHRLTAFVHHDAHDNVRARYHAEKAVALSPTNSQPHTMLGVVLDALGETEAALDSMRRAVDLNPKDPEAWTTLGLTLDALDRFDESIEAHRRALGANPGHMPAAMNLSLSLLSMGQAREAVDLVTRLVRVHPNVEQVAERLAFCMNYDDRATRPEINAAHRRWGRVAEAARPVMPTRSVDADRRLRIGFLSPDFRRHSIAHFIRPVLEHLSRDRFEVHAIFTSTRADEITEALRPLADTWHDVADLPEPTLAEHIREAGIDVLVDLSGHFAGNRLGVLSRKPSPLQLTWLGYPNTTGLTRVDARLVDSLTDQAELDSGLDTDRETERLIRLDPCFICYTPPADAPEPAPAPPCTTGEPFTYASFNDAKKMSPATLDMWANVLGRVAGSRLLLKCGALAAKSVRTRILAGFESRGVDPVRIELVGHTPDPTDHLAVYNRADLTLDTFPYHGTTTTCEALWMGVPVVTRVGETHAARVGLSLLTNVGLPELCVHDEQDFVDLAASLATDTDRLAQLRTGLRARVAASALTDANSFAARFGSTILELAATSPNP